LVIIVQLLILLAYFPASAQGTASRGAVFNDAGLRALLTKNPATGRPVDSIDELVPLLPRELRSNFTFVYDSRSPFRSSISPDHPRAILFTNDGRMVLTFTGDPSQPGANLLETMSFDDASSRFELHSYLLPAAVRRGWQPSPAATQCTSCHGVDPRPIFDSYPLWPGFYGSVLDTFSRDRLGRQEEAKYRAFLQGQAKAAPYRDLIFPTGSTVSPYLDPRQADSRAIQLKSTAMGFLPNTRLGMALTELNRARIFRKLTGGKEYSANEKHLLAELLECRHAGVGPSQAELQAIDRDLKLENAERLQRSGLRRGEPAPNGDDMQELAFVRELTEIDEVAKQAGADRSDWSMALAPGSLAFFDGILSGIYKGKSYYIKEDLIFEILGRLASRDAAFRPYFVIDRVFADLGYPFGNRIDLGKALQSCRLLSKA
jgi:hypothetical protein